MLITSTAGCASPEDKELHADLLLSSGARCGCSTSSSLNSGLYSVSSFAKSNKDCGLPGVKQAHNSREKKEFRASSSKLCNPGAHCCLLGLCEDALPDAWSISMLYIKRFPPHSADSEMPRTDVLLLALKPCTELPDDYGHCLEGPEVHQGSSF